MTSFIVYPERNITPEETLFISIVLKVRYKKGWRIELVPALSQEVCFRVIYETDDVETRDRIIVGARPVGMNVEMLRRGEEYVIRCLFEAIMQAERHEAAEYFKYKGVTVFNPHATVPYVFER